MGEGHRSGREDAPCPDFVGKEDVLKNQLSSHVPGAKGFSEWQMIYLAQGVCGFPGYLGSSFASPGAAEVSSRLEPFWLMLV